MKHVTATVLVRQMVETRLPVRVHVEDDTDEADIHEAVLEAAIEKIAQGLCDVDLTPQQTGWGRKDGFYREALEPQIPTEGEPMGTWEGAAQWERDDIVEIRSVE